MRWERGWKRFGPGKAQKQWDGLQIEMEMLYTCVYSFILCRSRLVCGI